MRNMNTIDVFKGTPRDLLCDPHHHKIPPRSGYEIVLETDLIPKRFDNLKMLLPEFTLAGQADEIPGLRNSFLPADVTSASAVPDFSPRKTLCLHGVRLENGQQMETILSSFLNKWRNAL